MTPARPTALTISTAAALAVSELPNREVSSACAECGVDSPGDLGAPQKRLPLPVVAALWDTIRKRVGDPSLALRAVAHVPPNAYRAMDYVASAAATVGAAFRQIAACFPLVNDGAQLVFEDCSDGTWIALDSVTPLPDVYVEYVLATICSRITEACWVDATPAESELAVPKRDHTRQHAHNFGRAIRFGAPRSRVRIARQTWATQLPTSDPGLLDVLCQHVRTLIAARTPSGTGPIAAARWAIRAQLAEGRVSLATVARRLATSSRTLQRQLAAHDVSFRDLLDQVRAEIVRARMTDSSHSIGDVASELGFSQPSSLTRAVRRWSGKAPSQLRHHTSTH